MLHPCMLHLSSSVFGQERLTLTIKVGFVTKEIQ
jgi:hypothetical protein